MKKITFLLTLLFMFAGTGVTWAQAEYVSATPTGSTFATDTKWYTIKNNSGLYFATNGNYIDADGNLKLVATKPTDNSGYWCLTGDATNGYELRNAAFPATMVMGMTGSEANARANLYYDAETDANVTKRFDIVTSAATGKFNIKLHGSDNNGFNKRGDYLALWNSSWISSDGNSQYIFEEVTETVTPAIERLRVNYSGTDTHTNYTWKDSKIIANQSTATLPELSYFYTSNAAFAESDLTITADNHNFTITISSANAPFEFSTPQNPKWYTMKTRNANTRYVVYEANNNIAAGGQNGNTPFENSYINNLDKLEGTMWAFVQDRTAVKLYNRKAQKYVTTTGNDATASMTDNGTKYLVETTTFEGGNFSLRQPGAQNSYLGAHRDANTKLGTWTNNQAQNNQGSSFTITPINNMTNGLEVAKGAYIHNWDAGLFNSYIGDASAITAEATTLANTATSIEEVIALKSKVLNGLNKVDTNKYFRLVFKRGNAAMTNMLANRTGGTAEEAEASYQVAWADANGEMAADNTSDDQRAVVVKPNIENGDIASIWQFEEIENAAGQYHIKHVNTGFYLGYTIGGNTHLHLLAKGADTNYAGHYSIETNNNTPSEKAFTAVNSTSSWKNLNTYYNPNAGNSTNNGRGLTCWTDGVRNDGNIIYLKEVTEIPVSISAASYSTLNLPFAVTIPTTTENPIKAYTVTNVNDDKELVMEELTGVIPANTAVILQAGEGTYNFTIAPAAAPVEGNLLTGTTLERHGMEAGSYYGLANKTQGVAFYVANSTEVPANKAILKKDDVKNSSAQGANALTFFGETTGIGGVQTNTPADGDNTYYDLNGRRVMYPSRGIYVKGNGQKVFIK